MAFAAAVAALLYYRGLSPVPRTTNWLVRSLAAGVVVGAGIWAALRLFFTLAMTGQMLHVTNPTQYVALVLAALGLVGWAVVGLVLVWLGVRRLGPGLRFGATAAGTFLVLQIAALAVLYVWEVPVRPTSDLQFVGRFLAGIPPRKAARCIPSTARSANRLTFG